MFLSCFRTLAVNPTRCTTLTSVSDPRKSILPPAKIGRCDVPSLRNLGGARYFRLPLADRLVGTFVHVLQFILLFSSKTSHIQVKYSVELPVCHYKNCCYDVCASVIPNCFVEWLFPEIDCMLLHSKGLDYR